jgi:hypothetical protein
MGCGLAVLAGAPTAWGQATGRATYKNPAQLDIRIPPHHPYLAVTPAELERAAERIKQLDWAKQICDRYLRAADADIAMPWGHLTGTDEREHRREDGRLFRAGMAYALSGDKRYAQWGRDGLLAYADFYPRLPLTRDGCRLFPESTLYEAMWAVRMAQAYDLVADSGVFTEEQKKHVENDLLRLAATCFKIDDFKNDPRIKNLHFRCYNFESWHISAVGLIGLATRDRDLIDYAVNSPYGFRHLVAHDIRDDGMFWERSEGYHYFVLEALVPLAVGMGHCGIDLFGMTLPNDRSWEEGAHYVTDISDKPKSLRMMFDAPFYLTFPDLSYPAMGDSEGGPLRGTGEQLAAYQYYRDPLLAWLLARNLQGNPGGASPATPNRRGSFPDWHWLIDDLPPASAAAFPAPFQEGAFANSGEYRNGCSLFPATGLAVLREASGDFTPRPDSTAVSLSFGPHAGGHGHSDQLNMVVYTVGRQWIPALGNMPYETHWKSEWTSQTVSHNTLVVDGISQEPTGEQNMEWPTDDSTDQVIGRLERFAPEAKLARASCGRAYSGIMLRRTVRLVGHAVVDDYTASPEDSSSPAGQHQYDYVLHIDGELTNSSLPLVPRSGALGTMCGYQYVEQQQGGSAAGPLSLTFAAGAKELRLWILPTGSTPTEVILGEGLTNRPNERMPMLILRRKAAHARFVTAIEAVESRDPLRGVRLEENANGEAGGLILERSSGEQRVSLNEFRP